MTLPFRSPLYELGVAGPEETKNLARKILRLIQIRWATPSAENISDIGKVNCREDPYTTAFYFWSRDGRLALRVQRNASVMESARDLPLRVSTKFPFDFRSSWSPISSSVSCAKSFSSEAEIPSRVRNPSAIRSVRFISCVRFSLGVRVDSPESARLM